MQQCFDIAKEQNFQTFKLETNRIFAVTASYTNNKDLALQYFLEALKYAKNSSEDISIRNDIAVLYIQANKNDLARTLLLEGLSTMEDENSEDQFLLHTYTNLCIVSTSLKEGILYIDKALKIAQKLGYQEKELEVLTTKASHYKKHKKYQLAIPILENVVTQARLLNQKNYEYKATLLLVKCLSETGKYYQAKDYIKPVIELTKSLQDKESLYELDSIAFKVYTKTNSFKEAVFYADNYISHLYNTRNANRDSLFIEYAKKYETDLKIKENEILKKDNQIKGLTISKEKNKRNLFIAIAMVILIGLIFMYYRYRSKKKTSELLAVKNQTITKQNQALEEANQTKQKFFSIIAHDLINPFNAILGYTNVLESDFDSFNDNEKKEFITIINKYANQNYKLTQNLLDWARVQQDKIQLKKEYLNIKDTVLHVVDNYEVLANKKNITTQLEIEENLKVYADANALKTILTNLYANAIKFSPIGKKITLEANVAKNQTCIIITDQGVGMTQHQINSLFNLSKTSSTSGTENEKGTGLGLLISKELLDLHHGTLTINSEKNLGTVITIAFPND
jgi:signal transduction histidine kinase